VGATDMNEKSSRSHAIFSVTMLQQKQISNNNSYPMSPTTPTYSRPGTPSSRFSSRAPSRANSVMSSRFDDGEWVTITSKFHFVDLAGSERVSSFLIKKCESIYTYFWIEIKNILCIKKIYTYIYFFLFI
jgi:hypothetical protein